MTTIKEPEVVPDEATAMSHKILNLCAETSKIVIVDSLALALGFVLTDCDPRLHASIIARSNTIALNLDEHIRSNGPKDAPTREAAIASWNRRAPPPSVDWAEVGPGLLEALRKLNLEARYMAMQLAHRGLPGVKGDSVDRALDAAVAILSRATPGGETGT